MATEPRHPGGTLRLSSARLALLYAVLVTVFTSSVLLSVYLLTRNALEREISAVVRAEVDDLSDDLRLGGIAQVAATLRLRADSWGRTGAVFLLADPHFRPLAGNLTAWPRDVVHAVRTDERAAAAAARDRQRGRRRDGATARL